MLRGTTLAVLSCALAVSVRAQTYYLMSQMTNGDSGPPLPMNPCATCPVYSVGVNKYWIDDRYESGLSISSFSAMTADSIDPNDGNTNGISTNYNANGLVSPMDLSYETNGSLWIQVTNIDSDGVHLVLHNKAAGFLSQWLGATNLVQANWTPGEIRFDTSGPTDEFFAAIVITNAQTFFRGQQANTVIFASVTAFAYETNATLGIPGQPGSIQFSAAPGVANPLIVHYSLGGSAQNGIDYTNLSGVATIPGSGNDSVTVYVQPISPTTLTNPIETVDFAVQPSTNYLVAPSQYTGTVPIKSSSTTISVQQSGLAAIRPIASGQPEVDGAIFFSRLDDFNLNPPITVYYQISGTASNGVDYQLLSGSFIFAQDSQFTNITIFPLPESLPQGIKTVTATVISSNGYVADPDNFTCTINLYDQTNTASISGVAPAINSGGPPGAPVLDGWFTIDRSEAHGFTPPLTVNYSMNGEAINGADYSTLSGTVTFADGQTSTNVLIHPISHWTNAAKTVVMTLIPGIYVVNTNAATVTNEIDNSSTQISLSWGQDAIEATNGIQPGVFIVQRYDPRGFYPALSVHYALGGIAVNGGDYSNLTGVITFAAGASNTSTNLYIWPITNTGYPGDKSVTVTLVPATNYFIDTFNASNGLYILDNTIQFQTVTNLSSFAGPVGIDYDPYLTNLIISGGSETTTFSSLGANITMTGGSPVTNLFMTNWSGIRSLPDEVYFTVVTNTASGFTNGDMFFGSTIGIGWLSSNAAMSNLSWCVLTNAQETNALLLRGGLYMDTVGSFSNNIVAVTSSDDPVQLGPKGVWEVDAHGHPTLLAHINAALLEGVAVVRTNFGPWSGKIITGDELSFSLYTVDNNGAVATNDSLALFPNGIHSESIQIIPPNQSLYLCDPVTGIVKLSKNYFTNYVGDLLIEDGGENQSGNAKLFIIHWDSSSGKYITRRFQYTVGGQIFEHCTFAPIELPAQ